MEQERLKPPAPAGRKWTGVEAYFTALARRRTARRSREPGPRRTQPEAPRFSLSTLPFLALLLAFAVLAAATIIIAWPGNQPPPERNQVAAHEQGYAPKGWLKEAEKDMHR